MQFTHIVTHCGGLRNFSLKIQQVSLKYISVSELISDIYISRSISYTKISTSTNVFLFLLFLNFNIKSIFTVIHYKNTYLFYSFTLYKYKWLNQIQLQYLIDLSVIYCITELNLKVLQLISRWMFEYLHDFHMSSPILNIHNLLRMRKCPPCSLHDPVNPVVLHTLTLSDRNSSAQHPWNRCYYTRENLDGKYICQFRILPRLFHHIDHQFYNYRQCLPPLE